MRFNLKVLATQALVAAAIGILAPSAMAQATRTWVSGVGDDVNPCSRTAPCKTFAGAISKTAAGGEISVLDPGGFGAVTITKSITIDGGGITGSILAALTNGVIVNAGVNDKVILRNLSINGATTGVNGVRFLAGAELTIEDTVIFGFQSSATSRAVDVSKAASGELTMNRVSIFNCHNGVRLNTTAGAVTATLNNVTISNSTLIGFEAATNATASIALSTISHNNGDAVRSSTASARINLDRNVLVHNLGAAANAFASGAQIRMSDNLVMNNGTGLAIAAGAFISSTGDNRVDANGATAAPNATFNVD